MLIAEAIGGYETSILLSVAESTGMGVGLDARICVHEALGTHYMTLIINTCVNRELFNNEWDVVVIFLRDQADTMLKESQETRA